MELSKYTRLNDGRVRNDFLYLLRDVINPILNTHEKDYPLNTRRELRAIKNEIREEIVLLTMMTLPQILTYLDNLLTMEHYRKRDSTLRTLHLPTFSSIVSKILFYGRHTPSMHTSKELTKLHIHTKKSG